MTEVPATLPETDPLLQSDSGGVRTLTLNRPRNRNALSDDLIARLHSAFAEASEDKTVRAVILAANGPAFCAGHDLREVAAKKGMDDYLALFSACSQMMLAIVRTPKPVIAQVQGMATAAGCQLVATCDLAVAAEEAKFAAPGVNIGLFCSTPMVALSRKVGRKTAMKMLLTGEPLGAKEAAAAGLINEAVSAEELQSHCRKLAETVAGKSAVTIAIGKEAFYRQAEMPLEEAYRYAGEVMAQNMTKEDAQEGITAFLKKRPPLWRDR